MFASPTHFNKNVHSKPVEEVDQLVEIVAAELVIFMIVASFIILMSVAFIEVEVVRKVTITKFGVVVLPEQKEVIFLIQVNFTKQIVVKFIEFIKMEEIRFIVKEVKLMASVNFTQHSTKQLEHFTQMGLLFNYLEQLTLELKPNWVTNNYRLVVTTKIRFKQFTQAFALFEVEQTFSLHQKVEQELMKLECIETRLEAIKILAFHSDVIAVTREHFETVVVEQIKMVVKHLQVVRNLMMVGTYFKQQLQFKSRNLEDQLELSQVV